MASKIYLLVTGDLYQKIKNMKMDFNHMSIETTDTYVIGGFDPLKDSCILTRFNDSENWRCFNTLEEAKEAASKL